LVFCDIDDTLTTHGKLDAEAYDALWQLRRAGLAVVPVTGRPAGWCDAIVRQWPVDAVIGENGAFVFHEDAGGLRARFHPAAVGPGATDGFPSHQLVEAIRGRLLPVRDSILAKVPGSRVAKDQAYRLFDLAIDFREEEPDLGLEAAERIRDEAVRLGCVAKISSIHVNCWFGAYDKLAMARQVAQELFAMDPAASRHQALFVGDSPNDAPMFAAFPVSAGVANIQRFASRMEHLPAYVASRPGGLGFAEIARVLLGARGVC
jgi:HAD superfamily hydrolase (TIGR01484 family)